MTEHRKVVSSEEFDLQCFLSAADRSIELAIQCAEPLGFGGVVYQLKLAWRELRTAANHLEQRHGGDFCSKCGQTIPKKPEGQWDMKHG